MIWVKVVLSVVGLVFVSWLGIVLVRFNLKRQRIIRAAARATSEQLEEIYLLIEAISSEKGNGFVLARLNETADDDSCIVAIPSNVLGFPWAGLRIAVEVDKDVRFRFLDDSGRTTQLLGKKYRPVMVPRVRLKSGKLRNQFFPSQYIKRNERLGEMLGRICPDYPTELLSHLLCVGQPTFEFEPIDQGRIGTTAAWVQDPEFQYCDRCKKKMALIVQLPGTLLHKKAFHRGTFYFFGCRKHVYHTSTVAQFT